MNEDEQIPVRVKLRCANAACEHEWIETPMHGRTWINSCPKCNHSLSQIVRIRIDMERDLPNRCDAVEVPPNYMQVGLGSKLVCQKVKGHAGPHLAPNGAIWGSVSTFSSETRSPCTLDNCGHMRQLDDIVTFLGMPRGGISVLDFLRTRAPMSAQTSVGTFHEQVKMRAGVLHDALAEMSRPEDELAAIEAALLHAYDAGKAPMSSETVSEVEVSDRYKVEAADLIAEIARFLQVSLEGIDTKGLVRGVRETIRKANSDGILEGQRQAKAEWGEAVEESDESRASRVVRILMDDGDMSSGQPDVIEERLAAEFAEVRAVWMREIAPRGYECTEAVKAFDRELEKHRRNIYAMRESRGISDNMVADAIFFLLALAHQPVLGGSSPAHAYREAVASALATLENHAEDVDAGGSVVTTRTHDHIALLRARLGYPTKPRNRALERKGT